MYRLELANKRTNNFYRIRKTDLHLLVNESIYSTDPISIRMRDNTNNAWLSSYGGDITITKKLSDELESIIFQKCTMTGDVLPLTDFTFDRGIYGRQCRAHKNRLKKLLIDSNYKQNIKIIKKNMTGDENNTEGFLCPHSGELTAWTRIFIMNGVNKLLPTYDLHHFNYDGNISIFKGKKQPSNILKLKNISEAYMIELFCLFALSTAPHCDLHKAIDKQNLSDWNSHWDAGYGHRPYFLQSKENWDECIKFAQSLMKKGETLDLDYDKFMALVTSKDVFIPGFGLLTSSI